MRAAIYIRVSSEMQLDGYSLDGQLAACKRLASARGWDVVTVYVEEAESAKTDNRAEFQKMMRAARRGTFESLIVYKLDRFARNRRDTENYLHELDQYGVRVVSATEPQFDFTTAAGKAYLGMVSTFNQYYVDLLGENVAMAKKERAQKGLWNGAAPFGYEVEYKKDGGDGLAYVDEHDAEGVRLAFQKYATGQYSDADIARLLNEAGYRPRGRGDRALRLFSKDTVTAMLQNRFYLGEVRYKEQWFEGVHEAILSERLFERAQAARAGRRSKRAHLTARRGSRVYPLTGVARCARCGGRMRGSWANGRYYRDPARDKGRDCDQRMVNAEDAEAALGEFLGGLCLPDDWQARVLTQIGRQADGQDVAREQARLEGQLERLKRLFVLGDLAESEYRAERDRLKAQLKTLTPPAMPDLEKAVALLADFGAIWEEATLKERRCIVHTLLETVYLDVDRGPVVAVEPKAAFEELFDLMVSERPSGGGSTGKIMIISAGTELRGYGNWIAR